MTIEQFKQLRLDIINSWQVPFEEGKKLYVEMAGAVRKEDL